MLPGARRERNACSSSRSIFLSGAGIASTTQPMPTEWLCSENYTDIFPNAREAMRPLPALVPSGTLFHFAPVSIRH